VNFGETGIGAVVVRRSAQLPAPLPGRASFLFAALSAVTRSIEDWGSVQVDGRTLYEGRVVSVVVANGSHFGGGMKIAPGASIDDGLLDAVVLADFTKAE